MRKLLTLLFVAFLVAAEGRVCFFFSPERKIEIVGKVVKIEENQSFCRSDYFVVITLKDRRGREFKVYVSPAWFFTERPGLGEEIKIKGSYSQNNRTLVIAEWIYSRGEKFLLRDSRGFPLWSGRKRRFGKERRRSKGIWGKR